MLGLERYNPPAVMALKSNPVEMLRALGYMIPECREREILKYWDSQTALRWYMRFRAFVGESRENIQNNREAIANGTRILKRAGCSDSHHAIEVLDNRVQFIDIVLSTLSDIERDVTEKHFTKPHKISDKPERMADLLREVMTRHEECDASMTKE